MIRETDFQAGGKAKPSCRCAWGAGVKPCGSLSPETEIPDFVLHLKYHIDSILFL
ncbi:MAG: hypothetical protein KKA12_13995 [Alphaproteobacteria bacterium]|nr:hypothetical protein [Alphaproteobacteria bacterium]